jgi:hypothetical protein
MIDLEKTYHVRVRAIPNGKYSVVYLDPKYPDGGWLTDRDRTHAEFRDFCHQQWPGRFDEQEIDEIMRRAPRVGT